jgi:hypothetical protein
MTYTSAVKGFAVRVPSLLSRLSQQLLISKLLALTEVQYLHQDFPLQATGAGGECLQQHALSCSWE